MKLQLFDFQLPPPCSSLQNTLLAKGVIRSWNKCYNREATHYIYITNSFMCIYHLSTCLCVYALAGRNCFWIRMTTVLLTGYAASFIVTVLYSQLHYKMSLLDHTWQLNRRLENCSKQSHKQWKIYSKTLRFVIIENSDIYANALQFTLEIFNCSACH